MSCRIGSWMTDDLDESVDSVRLDLGEHCDAVDVVVPNKSFGNLLGHANALEECS